MISGSSILEEQVGLQTRVHSSKESTTTFAQLPHDFKLLPCQNTRKETAFSRSMRSSAWGVMERDCNSHNKTLGGQAEIEPLSYRPAFHVSVFLRCDGVRWRRGTEVVES